MTQVTPKTFWIGALVMVVACGGPSAPPFIAPANPEATVTSFLSAVQSNDLMMMGRLWGTKDGPALGRMDREELQMRLTVMRAYLVHDRFEVLPPDPGVITDPNEKSLTIELVRNACAVTVPFMVVETNSGWLISSVDLNDVGNPMIGCRVP